MTEPEELIDGNGYPTEEALDFLRSFHGSAEDMVAYIRSLMNNGSSTLEDFIDDYGRDEKRLTLVTGGWSGCEDVISALNGTMFNIMFWESSHRGGKHTFTFSPQQLAMVLIWGDPAAVPTHTKPKGTSR
jgi:hypothetical protein